jgi:hypothetical protein
VRRRWMVVAAVTAVAVLGAVAIAWVRRTAAPWPAVAGTPYTIRLGPDGCPVVEDQRRFVDAPGPLVPPDPTEVLLCTDPYSAVLPEPRGAGRTAAAGATRRYRRLRRVTRSTARPQSGLAAVATPPQRLVARSRSDGRGVPPERVRLRLFVRVALPGPAAGAPDFQLRHGWPHLGCSDPRGQRPTACVGRVPGPLSEAIAGTINDAYGQGVPRTACPIGLSLRPLVVGTLDVAHLR